VVEAVAVGAVDVEVVEVVAETQNQRNKISRLVRRGNAALNLMVVYPQE